MTTSSRKPSWWKVLGALPAAVAVLVAANTLYMLLVVTGNITE